MPSTARPAKKINRATHVEMICTVLRGAPGHLLSRDDLYAGLCAAYTPWTRKDFDERLGRFIADDSIPIAEARGDGNPVRYTGSERGGGDLGSGLHNAVATVLESHGVPGAARGTRLAHVTANRRDEDGAVWRVPDIVMQVTRPSATEPMMVTFEVEQQHGFDIRSIYQAHAQGIGADASWVLFDRGGRNDADLGTDGARIVDIARLLGIGLISFSKPSVHSTWKVIRPAVARPSTKAERAALVELFEKATD